eukprot:4394122-Prymnesium_polylepis.1
MEEVKWLTFRRSRGAGRAVRARAADIRRLRGWLGAGARSPGVRGDRRARLVCSASDDAAQPTGGTGGGAWWGPRTRRPGGVSCGDHCRSHHSADGEGPVLRGQAAPRRSGLLHTDPRRRHRLPAGAAVVERRPRRGRHRRLLLRALRHPPAHIRFDRRAAVRAGSDQLSRRHPVCAVNGRAGGILLARAARGGAQHDQDHQGAARPSGRRPHQRPRQARDAEPSRAAHCGSSPALPAVCRSAHLLAAGRAPRGCAERGAVVDRVHGRRA